jgi:hypothetical protein
MTVRRKEAGEQNTAFLHNCAQSTMFSFTGSNNRLSKPSLLRGRTTETSTTAAMSHITDEEEGSGSVYTISQFDDRANENDDFVMYSHSNIDEDDVEIMDDADNESIEELISSTSRRWKQEMAHLVRQTATGTQFPNSASALQDKPMHFLATLPGQLQHQQEQYCYISSGNSSYAVPLSSQRHSAAPLPRTAAPPPVAVLDVPHTQIDDDDLTIETAFTASPSTRRPTHEETTCFW